MALPLLKGVRVIELALLMPADHVGGMLADLGAEVIKVEQPPNGDYVRNLGGILDPGISEFHLFFNRGKKSLAVNLKTEEGLAIFQDVLKTTDVVYESGTPQSRIDMKVDYESCKKIKPDIIYLSFPGFGFNGPYAHIPAHGWGVAAFSGTSPIERLPDGRLKVGTGGGGGAGFGGPALCAMAISAALFHRQMTGEGCFLDVAMCDANIYAQHSQAFKGLNSYTVKVPQRPDNATTTPIRFTYYSCKDGKVLAFQAVERKFWENFCRAVGQPEWIARGGEYKLGGDSPSAVDYGFNQPELEQELIKLFKTKSMQEWVKFLGDADVPVIPGYTISEVVEDDHAKMRQQVYEYDHPGFGHVKQVAFPVTMPDVKYSAKPAPWVGEDDEDILVSMGYSQTKISELRNSKIIL